MEQFLFWVVLATSLVEAFVIGWQRAALKSLRNKI
jgi:hypothetical protein